MTECNNYRVLDTPIWAPRQALFRDSRSTCFCLPKTEVKRGERSPDADVVEPFFCPLPCVSRILVYSALAIGLLSPLSQKYERMYMVTRYRRPPSAAVTKISKRGVLVLVQYVHAPQHAPTHHKLLHRFPIASGVPKKGWAQWYCWYKVTSLPR